MIFIKCTVVGSHELIFFVAPNLEIFLADTKQGKGFAGDKINTYEEVPTEEIRKERPGFYKIGAHAMEEAGQNYLLGYVS